MKMKSSNVKTVWPTTFSLMKEALAKCEDKKGLSYLGIRAYIAKNYPMVADKGGFSLRLKKAMTKGLEEGIFTRPKKDVDITSFSKGLFKVSRSWKS
jgi:hypothetical protein